MRACVCTITHNVESGEWALGKSMFAWACLGVCALRQGQAINKLIFRHRFGNNFNCKWAKCKATKQELARNESARQAEINHEHGGVGCRCVEARQDVWHLANVVQWATRYATTKCHNQLIIKLDKQFIIASIEHIPAQWCASIYNCHCELRLSRSITSRESLYMQVNSSIQMNNLINIWQNYKLKS